MNSAGLALPNSEKNQLEDILCRLEKVEKSVSTRPQSNELSLLVFSGELDKLLAAFNIANAAAACGMNVSIFFTFWGTAALKKTTLYRQKSLVEKAFGFLLPGGFETKQLSRLDMFGIGRRLIGREMRHKEISSLPAMVDVAGTLGVQIYICEMSMRLMGITEQELIDYPDKKFCGAAKYLSLANSATTSLFV